MKLRLYCADCVQGIPLKVDRGSVDVAVTSPPYNIGTSYHTYEDSLSSEEYLTWTLKWTRVVRNTLRDDGSLFLNLGAPPSWIPQETLDVVKDIDKPIVFMEGRTNGEALLKAGAFPIGLQGRRLKLRTELASFAWEYRRVYLSLRPQGKKDRWLEIRAWILLRLAGAEGFQHGGKKALCRAGVHQDGTIGLRVAMLKTS